MGGQVERWVARWRDGCLGREMGGWLGREMGGLLGREMGGYAGSACGNISRGGSWQFSTISREKIKTSLKKSGKTRDIRKGVTNTNLPWKKILGRERILNSRVHLFRKKRTANPGPDMNGLIGLTGLPLCLHAPSYKCIVYLDDCCVLVN
jgi:hypothetical protein